MTLNRPSQPQRANGFAIIVTVSILVLLAVIAVGLLTLSTVTVRGSALGSAKAEARANARLALTIAIGELQKHAGPDQRVTASGGIAGENVKQPHWTGVWSTKSSDTAPVWLVSGNDSAKVGDLDDFQDHPAGYLTPSADPSGDAVEIFKSNNPLDTVRVQLMDVSNGQRATGRYAYWVSDEGSKARVDIEVPTGRPVTRADVAQRAAKSIMGQEPNFGEVDASLFPLSDPDSELNKKKLVSFDSLDVALDGKEISEQFSHHLTTGGYGLPVNVVKGGTKTDLSVVFDSSQLRNRNMYNAMLGATPQSKSIGNGGPPIYDFPSVTTPETFYLSPELAENRQMEVGPNWGNLYNYGQLWKQVQAESVKPFSFNPPLSTDLRTNTWAPYANADTNSRRWNEDLQHTNSSMEPLLCVLQMGFRITAEEAPLPESDQIGYRLKLQMKPLVGFWNPYNIKITSRHKQMQWALYPHIRINANCPRVGERKTWFGQRPRKIRTNIWMREHWKQGSGLATVNSGGSRLLLQTDPIDFEPGEIRLFSVEEQADMERINKLEPTWNEDGGFNFDLVYSAASSGDGTNDQQSPGTSIIVPKGSDIFYGGAYLEDSVKARTREYFGDEIFDGVTSSYVTVGGGEYNIGHRISDIWQPMTESGRDSVGIQGGKTWVVPEPVVSTWVKTNGASVADKIPVELLARTPYHIGTWRVFSRNTTEAIPAEGGAGSQRLRTWVDTNPRFGPMNPAWDGSKTDSNKLEGFHFVSPFIGGSLSNRPWDGGPRGRGLVAEGQNEAGAFPEATLEGGRYRGFGGSSTSSFGQSHVPLFDIPRAPLVSLGQFQHAQLSRYGYEPAFPFGNSHASIHLPLDQTFVDDYAEIEGFRMTDISHSVNKTVWDDCFFSTIGADYLGGGGGSLDSLFPMDELLSGERKLTNPRHFYIPLSENESIDDIVKRTDGAGPKALAARIGVQGAFNVNSTSKEAWKAVLASMANFEFPVLSQNGEEVSWEQSEAIRLPRFGHVMQKDGWAANGDISDPAFWNGFREISSEELDTLAENIVKEIRDRGPFRSFADFVNRDPDSEDSDHQRIGALQAALDRSLNAVLVGDLADPANSPEGEFFTDVVGEDESTAAGFAGYVMQGDVLQALAPVLQVRTDYFRVRALGQATNAKGEVIATAACEAYVQRIGNYIDPEDETHLGEADLQQEINKNFGRRFKIASFRWLDSTEI